MFPVEKMIPNDSKAYDSHDFKAFWSLQQRYIYIYIYNNTVFLVKNQTSTIEPI